MGLEIGWIAFAFCVAFGMLSMLWAVWMSMRITARVFKAMEHEEGDDG